jgi:hypothetical protein
VEVNRTVRDPQPVSRIFDTVSSGDEYVVIDTSTGHPVSAAVEWWKASHMKDVLNTAAGQGAKQLAKVIATL